jgi:hypothetical protein
MNENTRVDDAMKLLKAAADVDNVDIRELIYEAYSEKASETNKQGLRAQAEFLLSECQGDLDRLAHMLCYEILSTMKDDGNNPS